MAAGVPADGAGEPKDAAFGDELFTDERRDGLRSTAEHYISVYSNLLRFVASALEEGPAEPERGTLARWQLRFEQRLAFWNQELARIRRRHRDLTRG